MAAFVNQFARPSCMEAVYMRDGWNDKAVALKKLSAYSSLGHLWATAVGNFSPDVSRFKINRNF